MTKSDRTFGRDMGHHMSSHCQWEWKPEWALWKVPKHYLLKWMPVSREKWDWGTGTKRENDKMEQENAPEQDWWTCLRTAERDHVTSAFVCRKTNNEQTGRKKRCHTGERAQRAHSHWSMSQSRCKRCQRGTFIWKERPQIGFHSPAESSHWVMTSTILFSFIAESHLSYWRSIISTPSPLPLPCRHLVTQAELRSLEVSCRIHSKWQKADLWDFWEDVTVLN